MGFPASLVCCFGASLGCGVVGTSAIWNFMWRVPIRNGLLAVGPGRETGGAPQRQRATQHLTRSTATPQRQRTGSPPHSSTCAPFGALPWGLLAFRLFNSSQSFMALGVADTAHFIYAVITCYNTQNAESDEIENPLSYKGLAYPG